MKWTSVEDDLPKNGQQVIALIQGYFYNIDDPLSQKKSLRVFQCNFHRSQGWHIPFCPENCSVQYWMSLPEPPVEYKIALGIHDFPISNKSTEFPNG